MSHILALNKVISAVRGTDLSKNSVKKTYQRLEEEVRLSEQVFIMYVRATKSSVFENTASGAIRGIFYRVQSLKLLFSSSLCLRGFIISKPNLDPRDL